MRAGALAAAAMLALGLAGGAWAADDPSPRIVVSGNGTVTTPPDVATIEFHVVGEGATSDAAVGAMVGKRDRIVAALAALDSRLQPRAGEVSVKEVRGADCHPQYNQPQLSTGACAIIGYAATLGMTMRTAAVKDAGTAVGLIGRGGGSDARLASFDLADPGSAQRRAIAAALVDAKAKAAAVAQGGGVTLGRVLSLATNGYGGGEAEDIGVREVRSPLAPGAPPPPPPVSVTLTPRPIETRAQVTVVYAITP